MKKLLAIGDKISVRVVFKKTVRESGIVIPETIKTEPQNMGVVESVGDDVKYIKVGDTILFHPRGGQDCIFDDIIYKVLAESEIYGVLKEA